MYFYRQLVVLVHLVRSLLRVQAVKNKSECYMVFWPQTFNAMVNYFGRAYVLQDVTLYLALKSVYGRVKIRTYSECLKLGQDEEIFYSAVPFGRKGLNQGEHLYNLISQLNSKCYPSATEIRFWENKDYMHQQFEEFKIPSPKTWLVHTASQVGSINIDFPILTKILNGNHSKGIISHKNDEELRNYLSQNLSHYGALLLQEQLNIGFDIRVVTINYKVVYHYWRDKKITKEFNTTSTSNGSRLRVDPLPQEVVICAESSSKKLGLKLAAFDITYSQSEDKIIPSIFEVSPSFLLNPIPEEKMLEKPYINYKKKWNKFVIDRIAQFTKIKEIYVKEIQSR